MSSKKGQLDGNLTSAVAQVERRQAAVLERAEEHEARSKAEAAEARRLRELAVSLGRALSSLRDAEAAVGNGSPAPAEPRRATAEWGDRG
jgi:hypothetical protein